VRIVGIDPGSGRTGYGCVETDGRRHRLMLCGAITPPRDARLPERLARIHRDLTDILSRCRADCVAIEDLFHAANVRSALTLGHARGVAMLAAVEAGCPIVAYTPTAVKRSVVGYGRAEKHQIQRMVKLLLGLDKVPSPHDVADALAVAICHAHSLAQHRLDAGLRAAGALGGPAESTPVRTRRSTPRTWREYRPPVGG